MADHRCRLCTANDKDGVTHYLAEQLWESRRQVEMGDPPWAEVDTYWQTRFLELATTAILSLRE